jgi:hypothetical protein
MIGTPVRASIEVDPIAQAADSCRVRLNLLVVALMVTAATVGSAFRNAEVCAAPAAELVMVSAPGAKAQVAPALAAARDAGAAVMDVSPDSSPILADVVALRGGRAAYDGLRFEDALTSLRAAADSVDATGGAGFDRGDLSDLFLYRGLSAVQVGDPEHAWDDFVRAATVDVTRVLDPARFPPRAIEQWERAQRHVASLAPVAVRLRSVPGCAVWFDARATAEFELMVVPGRHWVVASCPGRRPLQRSFDVASSLEFDIAGTPFPTLSDEQALVSARAAGARAVLLLTVASEFAVVRRIGIDGREQQRRAVRLDHPEAARGLTDAVIRLLRREAKPTRWYHSRWAWASAGFVIASAVLLPLALQSDGTPDVVVRPTGVPW